jgi:5'-AMP-activated protein kinase catalytic alpha subunit
MPIDKEVLSLMPKLNLDPDYVSKCLEANRHNNATTAYYLSLRKFIIEGGQSSCDLSSKLFDKSILQPNRRKNTAANPLEHYFTKSTESETICKRPRSKDKSREKGDK